MTDTNKLKELAERATPGPWVVDAQQSGAIFNIESESGDLCIAMSQENPASTRLEMNEQRRVNAEFIAAANPAAVLELIAEVERLRQFAAEAYQVFGAMDAPANVLDNASDAASGVPLRHETLLPFFAEGYESLRKDADRYRWLRSKEAECNVEIPMDDGHGWLLPGYLDELDAAIDAALEGGGR
jgi:hypothetical protein